MTKISNNCQFVKLCIIGGILYFVYFGRKNSTPQPFKKLKSPAATIVAVCTADPSPLLFYHQPRLRFSLTIVSHDLK